MNKSYVNTRQEDTILLLNTLINNYNTMTYLDKFRFIHIIVLFVMWHNHRMLLKLR